MGTPLENRGEREYIQLGQSRNLVRWQQDGCQALPTPLTPLMG